MKLQKKLLVLSLATTTFCTSSAMVFAEVPNIPTNEYYLETTSNCTLENSGINHFFDLTEDGFIALDIESAKLNGISEQIILQAQTQIDYMNDLVTKGRTYINEDFDAITVFPKARAAARGVNKTITHWYGATDYYMDSIKAQGLIDNIEKFGTEASSLHLPTALANIISVMNKAQVWQLKQAAKNGNGIIMRVQQNLYDISNPAPIIFFLSQ